MWNLSAKYKYKQFVLNIGIGRHQLYTNAMMKPIALVSVLMKPVALVSVLMKPIALVSVLMKPVALVSVLIHSFIHSFIYVP